MAITKKQTEALKSQYIDQLREIRVNIHYGNFLLLDTRSDLKSEASNLTKMINKNKARIKKVEEKIKENGGRVLKLDEWKE